MDNGEWVQGYYCLNAVLLGTIEEEIYSTITPFYEMTRLVHPVTIGQCTGLKDKNGTLIFEGDVVRWQSDDPELAKCGVDITEVRWMQAGWLADIGTDAIVLGCERTQVGGNLCEWEIIGNIHDNPELLEVQS